MQTERGDPETIQVKRFLGFLFGVAGQTDFTGRLSGGFFCIVILFTAGYFVIETLLRICYTKISICGFGGILLN